MLALWLILPDAEYIPVLGLVRLKNVTFFELRTLWKVTGGEALRVFIAEEQEYEDYFHRTLEEAQEMIREGTLGMEGYNSYVIDGRLIYN